jgi:glycosyltransferase involved in cell wall biosynthesis
MVDTPRAAPAPGAGFATLDLDWFAPEKQLLQNRGPEIKRFRRLHRLAHPIVLFVGPYTPAGGLETLVGCVYELRERVEDVRLAALPLGPTDQRYLDRCEAEALALGHHGIVEWTPEPGDVPFWYATATVVCAPWTQPGPADPLLLAAAAGRPFVGSDLPAFREAAGDSEAVTLVPIGARMELVAALERLVADLEEAARLGAAARLRAEAGTQPAANGSKL